MGGGEFRILFRRHLDVEWGGALFLLYITACSRTFLTHMVIYFVLTEEWEMFFPEKKKKRGTFVLMVLY